MTQKHLKSSNTHGKKFIKTKIVMTEQTCVICPLFSIVKSLKQSIKQRKRQKGLLRALGYSYDLLKKNNFEDAPIPYSENNCSDDDDDDEDDERKPENELTIGKSNNLWKGCCYQDSKDMTDDITKLNSIGIIEEDLCCHLSNLHKSQFKCISGLSLPMYDKNNVLYPLNVPEKVSFSIC